jgi:hypothetical protein
MTLLHRCSRGSEDEEPHCSAAVRGINPADDPLFRMYVGIAGIAVAGIGKAQEKQTTLDS